MMRTFGANAAGQACPSPAAPARLGAARRGLAASARAATAAEAGRVAPGAWRGRAGPRGLAPTWPSASAAAARVAPARAASTAAPPASETLKYEAEVDRMMDMIVNSLYSNREVFLRELVSNASDALDKARISGLRADGGEGEAPAPNADAPPSTSSRLPLEIKIRADPASKTITIEDSGVGMTREELVSSLGTIARSGTAKFAAALEAGKAGDANLIGRFGVGFYSAFLVADEVTVDTKSDGDASAWRWSSSAGAHQYTVSRSPEEVQGAAGEAPSPAALVRGTRVTLHLKPEATDMADSGKLKELLRKYSEFVAFPIRLWQEETKEEPELDQEATEKRQAEADAKALAEGKATPAEPVEPVYTPRRVNRAEWKTTNDQAPLWTRSAREVTRDEQNAFFRATFKEFLDPLGVSQFRVEGGVEFSGLLFVPGMAPMEQGQVSQKPRNVRLYVRRVFISDDFDDSLLPRWASFVKGVVDSADLPLNVSREILQESRVTRAIARQLTRRTLDMLDEIAAREEGRDYDTFWEAFGRYLKVGIVEDQQNRDRLAKLLRFKSTYSPDPEALTSLDDYLARAGEAQESIYFLTAASRDAALASPFVEKLAKKDVEVLLLTEPVDEVVTLHLANYKGKTFVDVAREGVDFDAIPGPEDEDEADAAEGDDAAEAKEKKKKKAQSTSAAALQAARERLSPLLDLASTVLGPRVERVAVSNRLTDSPAVVVLSKFGWSANMERLARAQAMGEPREAAYMRGRRILELNPDHPVVRGLEAKLAAGRGEEAEKGVQLLFDAALLAGGYDIDNPKDVAARIYGALASDLESGAEAAADASRRVAEAEVVA